MGSDKQNKQQNALQRVLFKYFLYKEKQTKQRMKIRNTDTVMKREREIKGQRKEGRQCLPDRASK
jgi:ABC-type uncharacterized transport system YnjBCD substrate-binding protein